MHLPPIISFLSSALTGAFRIGLLSVLAVPHLAARAAEPPVYAIEDCLRIARERSLPLANARADLDIARENVRGVRAQVHPSVDAQANYTRLDELIRFPGMAGPIGSLDTYAASVTAEQLLYAGGAVRAALRIAEDYLAAAEARLEQTAAELDRQVARAFYGLLFLGEELAVAEASVKQLADFEQQVRGKYEAGAVAEFVWLGARVALANEEPRRIAAESALALARRAFRDLLYLDEEAFALEGSLDFNPPAWALPPLIERALATRPELREAHAGIQIAHDQIDIARADYRPELRAFATYGGADPSQRNPFAEGWEWEWTAGVRLSWKIMDGGLRKSQRRTRILELGQAENRSEELFRAVALEVETAWRKLNDAREQVRGTRDTVVLAERAIAIASTRFEQGLATRLDFTDSHLALNQAHLTRSRALLACHLALADLRRAVGADLPAPDKESTP